MNRNKIKKIIQEEVKLGIAKNAFGEEFEYILTEADMTDMLSGALGFVEKNIGQAGIDSIKQFAIKELFNYLESVGMPITVDSLFGSILINVFQNLTASDVATYFSDGGCEKIADRIIKGLQEGLQEDIVINKIVEVFFGEGAQLEGVLGSPIRELINIKLKDMTASLRDPLVDFACNHRNFEKLKSQISKDSINTSAESEESEAMPRSKSVLRFKK